LAISKARKKELVAQYVKNLEESQGAILADYRGLSVSQMDEVRAALRPIGGTTRVVKNRLLARALEEAGLSVPQEWLNGPTAVGFCHDEVPPVAKALVDVAKEHDVLRIKGGILGASVISAEEVQTIAALPSREVLLAQVLGTINAPAGQIAGVVASAIRQVLNVVQAYAEKLEESGSAPGTGVQQAVEPA
jgi:large subunit ribosomal protein L10